MSAKSNSVMMFVAMLVVLAGTAAQADLIHRWSFDGNGNNTVGTANASLFGTASISGGQLVLNGGGWASTSNLPETLTDKTFVTWVTLSNLGQNAGVLGIQEATGDWPDFDSASFGERTASQWMNGSAGWARTPENNGGALDTSTSQVMMAISYDGTSGNIQLYRNGGLYASTGPYTLRTFPGNGALAVLGARWISPLFGVQVCLAGSIDEARIYSTALSAGEISQLNAWGPNQIVPEPGTLALLGTALAGLLAYAWRKRR